MSQSQEIGNVYDRLKKLNNGLDVENLMYGVDGFYYNVFPKEWNRTFSGWSGATAPETSDRDSGFCGDPIYCERLWDEFKAWVKENKHINVKDFGDVEAEQDDTEITYELGEPLPFWEIVYMLKDDSIEEKQQYNDFDDARADFLYMTQEEPVDYQYVYLNEVKTNYADEEEVTNVDFWEDR